MLWNHRLDMGSRIGRKRRKICQSQSNLHVWLYVSSHQWCGHRR